MPISIPDVYVETFSNNVIHLAQQKTSKLSAYVMHKFKQSEAHNFELLDASVARVKTAARMVSPAGGDGSGAVGSTDGLDWTRRKTLIQTIDTGEIVERNDISQTLIDPKSNITQNLVKNMYRKMDDILISACNDPSRDGAGGAIALPASQQIGGAAEIISLDTLFEVQEILAAADVDPDERKCLVIGPTQQRVLMGILQVTSADYQEKKALATGYLPNFMGFDIIVSTRLGQTTTPPAGGEIYCLAFTDKAIGLHTARNMSATAAERADMSFSWQCYVDMDLGAIRVEDAHFVQIHLKDALV
jgi:hypothetical protein